MMLNLLLAAVLLQDPTVDDLVRSLGSEDIAVREKAAAGLSKVPIEKLPQLEKHLRDPNAELAARVRTAMGQVLASNLGSRKARFELRPAAPEATTDAWIAAGADPKNPPKGFEARRFHPSSSEQRDWILVQSPIATESDIVAAEAQPDVQRSTDGMKLWAIQIEMGPGAAARFDKMASELFALTPRGKAAILLDERVLSAPMIQSERFGGKAVIQGGLSEKDAQKFARALKGDWLESSLCAEKNGDAAGGADKAADFLRKSKGFDQATITPDATGLDVSGYLDLKQVDLVDLWKSLRDRGYRLAPKK